jgi:hypothetical protein
MKASQPAVPVTTKPAGRADELPPDEVSQGSDPDALLPHERDEAAHSTDPEPDPVMRRAYEDLKEGQVDTDMHGTPGLDAERRKELLRRQP